MLAADESDELLRMAMSSTRLSRSYEKATNFLNVSNKYYIKMIVHFHCTKVAFKNSHLRNSNSS